MADVVMILGSGPNAPEAADWPRPWFDRLVVINNAWQVRADWDDHVFPEDFPEDRRPENYKPGQRAIMADQFVPAQNAYGGFVYAGGTMAFTAAYWALYALRPRVLAFMGCDMVYPPKGNTHFYGTGTADPLRDDITLRDLCAKAARLGLVARQQGCACVNLSKAESVLPYPRKRPEALREFESFAPRDDVARILAHEDELGFFVPSGRYWEVSERFDAEVLAELDQQWRSLWRS